LIFLPNIICFTIINLRLTSAQSTVLAPTAKLELFIHRSPDSIHDNARHNWTTVIQAQWTCTQLIILARATDKIRAKNDGKARDTGLRRVFMIACVFPCQLKVTCFNYGSSKTKQRGNSIRVSRALSRLCFSSVNSFWQFPCRFDLS
jgi:hypothetical protein